jgi:hypothetical protein
VTHFLIPPFVLSSPKCLIHLHLAVCTCANLLLIIIHLIHRHSSYSRRSLLIAHCVTTNTHLHSDSDAHRIDCMFDHFYRDLISGMYYYRTIHPSIIISLSLTYAITHYTYTAPSHVLHSFHSFTSLHYNVYARITN